MTFTLDSDKARTTGRLHGGPSLVSVASDVLNAPKVVRVGVLFIDRMSHDMYHIECHSGSDLDAHYCNGTA